MKNFCLFLGTLLLASTFTSNSDAAGSVREKLAAAQNIGIVIPLDATTTYVAPRIGRLSGEITDEALGELYGICDALGGSYQQREDRTDPITGKVTTKYTTISKDLIKRKSDIAYSSIVTTTVAWKPASLICKDVFRIDEPLVHYFSGYAAGQSSVQSFVMTHKPEPMNIFKIAKFKAQSVKVPTDGYWTKTLPQLTKRTDGVLGFLDNAFDNNILDGRDAWLYLNTLAGQSGEKVRYAIRPATMNQGQCVSEGLREVSQAEAARYIALGRTGCGKGNSEWYVAATGGITNFVAMGKESRSGQNGDIITLDVYFESNRSIDDLAFFSNPGIIQPTSTVVSSGQPTGTLEEQFALQVAANKANMLKMQGGMEYQGLYNGVINGCDSVAVVSVFAPRTRAERSQTINYKVCNGVIAKSEETFEGLPPNMDQDIKRVARMAQQRGFGLAQVEGGYFIKGQALRSADKCMVEVKVFNGNRLLKTQTVNGCL